MAPSKKAARINVGIFVGAALLAVSQTQRSQADESTNSSTSTGRSSLTACSPDGAFYAAGGPDGRIKYVRAEDGKLMRTFYQCSPRKLAFSPDGHLLACAGGRKDDTEIQIWNLTDGRRLISIETALPPAPGLCFSATGSVVAFTVSPTRVAAWHVGKGEKLWSTDLGIRIASLHFDNKDGALVLEAVDGSARKLRWADASLMTTRPARSR